MNFEWITQINDVEKHIKEIVKNDESILSLFEILLNYNGVDAFVKMYELWKKAAIRFPFKHIAELKKIYVLQKPKSGVLNLSQLLDVDTSTISTWRRVFNGTSKKTKTKKQIIDDLLD